MANPPCGTEQFCNLLSRHLFAIGELLGRIEQEQQNTNKRLQLIEQEQQNTNKQLQRIEQSISAFNPQPPSIPPPLLPLPKKFVSSHPLKNLKNEGLICAFNSVTQLVYCMHMGTGANLFLNKGYGSAIQRLLGREDCKVDFEDYVKFLHALAVPNGSTIGHFQDCSVCVRNVFVSHFVGCLLDTHKESFE